MDFKVRRFIDGDEIEVCKLIAKDLREENIKDYTSEEIEKIVDSQSEERILERSKFFHTYVFLDDTKIIGVGMIGPYWDSLTESSLFTIFIDPLYKGKGLGRKIIETLEKDEFFLRAKRVEIPASITAVEFYKHMGYGFKKFGNIVDEEGLYRMEKYPKIGNNKVSMTQYNMRPFLDNKYHKDKEFIFSILNSSINGQIDSLNFIKENGEFLWIIQLNGRDIGFYNDKLKSVFLVPEYLDMGIEQQILNDMAELHNCKKSKNK